MSNIYEPDNLDDLHNATEEELANELQKLKDELALEHQRVARLQIRIDSLEAELLRRTGKN